MDTAPSTEHYLFRITLRDIDNPVITRTLSVPKSIAFHKFHKALQIAFGWRSTQSYAFHVMGPTKRIINCSTHVNHLNHLIRLEEHPEPNLGFLWPELPDVPMPKSTNVTLERILDDREYAGKPLEYLYDFEDNWEHLIEEIGTERGNGAIRCVSGSGHGALQDCGGILGWLHVKSVVRKLLTAADVGSPDLEAAVETISANDRKRISWLARCFNSRYNIDLDPDQWSMEEVNRQLARDL